MLHNYQSSKDVELQIEVYLIFGRAPLDVYLALDKGGTLTIKKLLKLLEVEERGLTKGQLKSKIRSMVTHQQMVKDWNPHKIKSANNS
jgi:hypothetical protein